MRRVISLEGQPIMTRFEEEKKKYEQLHNCKPLRGFSVSNRTGQSCSSAVGPFNLLLFTMVKYTVCRNRPSNLTDAEKYSATKKIWKTRREAMRQFSGPNFLPSEKISQEKFERSLFSSRYALGFVLRFLEFLQSVVH